MTREVDGYFDPCTQGPPTTTRGRPPLVEQHLSIVNTVAAQNLSTNIQYCK